VGAERQPWTAVGYQLRVPRYQGNLIDWGFSLIDWGFGLIFSNIPPFFLHLYLFRYYIYLWYWYLPQRKLLAHMAGEVRTWMKLAVSASVQLEVCKCASVQVCNVNCASVGAAKVQPKGPWKVLRTSFMIRNSFKP
jgi:hypothetical protein